MNIPTVLYLTDNLNKLEKLDQAVCECIKILLDRIETLETQVDILRRVHHEHNTPK